MVLGFLMTKGMLRIYMNVSLTYFLLFAVSCTSYSKYALYNSIPKETVLYQGDQYFKYEGSNFNGNYYKYTNDSLRMTMLIFGAYVHAHDKNKYKKILHSKELAGMVRFPTHKKLLYAFTTYHDNPMHFKTFIDLSVGRKKTYPKGYYTKTLQCDKKNDVTLTISDKISKNGAQFLMDNFKCTE
ncbi:hypothetical protein CMT56_12370 [Elizabethkingia anophelis]|uniref:hypothetical protein n=2 Tax=Elizabethkingia anophelis TaxID=1117645 RepID=UPI00038A06F9|nr:hypothetical protein [Elizabethkingia anophelis]EQB93847.1 hypothetical protein C874_03685 [Elizabethkingia anophelis 502]MCT3733152.1 hypothetical protein [Elizabethkingia anophelis]MCT3897825.1 hypothetical protein [Elizabethkingia anophelis]MCT4297085.1 hypothetical protein [Elizabethkingia anophelis]MCT4300633.1 hypothetical protein [Elizabethkingia anophelis]